MKRVVAILLIFLFIFSIPVSADSVEWFDPSPCIDFTVGTLVVGKEASVEIFTKRMPRCAYIRVEIEYDPMVLQAVGYESALSIGTVKKAAEEGGKFSIEWQADKEYPQGEFDFGAITFKVISRPEKGKTDIALRPRGREVTQADGNPLNNIITPLCPKNVYVDHPFKDVKKDAWYREAVLFVNDRGLMNGVGETAFAPEMTTTRAQLVTVLYRIEGEPAVSAKAPFKDVRSDWCINAVNWAYEKKIIKGTGETSFSPDDPVTREQIAAILYRYTQSKGFALHEGSIDYYPDAAQVSAYALKSMEWASGWLINGVLQLSGEKTLSPKGQATRAQIATLLMRYATYYPEALKK